MGSEGPPEVTVHFTGFKKFHGVLENPTETIVNNLIGYMQKQGFPRGLVIGSCNVLETAGEGALDQLYKVFELATNVQDNKLSSGRTILLHFGVNSGAMGFAVESQAVNEATFLCPDELGWKPNKIPIIPSDGGIMQTRETSLPVVKIVKSLSEMGYDVVRSYDAGRFVCNYVYYHSLRFAEQHGISSLFVHFPLFITTDEETQMRFAASLLDVLSCLN
ncbi:hypothetical protein HPP92_027792 [Vanilla planifolia]|uniref:Pyroglutamyl-peptidase I n=1 Tax=Vanilla planifolia TaxID=51239 RepID=A0A835UY28_VANPL|nr:hypothetical protein HPP92_027792 [Vanilla planifolia]KAG0476665.1 hypothetical protein HPP92_013506 [Vanilla planifolia]